MLYWYPQQSTINRDIGAVPVIDFWFGEVFPIASGINKIQKFPVNIILASLGYVHYEQHANMERKKQGPICVVNP